MVPAIGFIIGAYVIFRMLEVMFFPTSRYDPKGGHVFLVIAALGVIAVTAYSIHILLRSEGPASNILRALQKLLGAP